MQTTWTTRWSARDIAVVAMLGMLGIAALAAVAVNVLRDGSHAGRIAPASAASQITADAAFTSESELAYANSAQAGAAARQLTSDTVYSLEAQQVAQQQAVQAGRLTLTPDEAYALEQAQLAEQARHSSGVEATTWEAVSEPTSRGD
jgi:hypothetical protein